MGKTCHSLSKSPRFSLSSCCQLITNRNNNHKHIIQIKDRLPKHFALPFIISKVQAQSGISRSYGETKTIKPKRCAAADKLNRQAEAKQLLMPWGIYLFIYFFWKEEESKQFSYTDWSGVCWKLLDVYLTEVNSIVKETYPQNKQHHKTKSIANTNPDCCGVFH